MPKTASDHYLEAAEHHEQAAKHHEEAEKYQKLGDLEMEDFHTRAAIEHAKQASAASDEAFKVAENEH